MRNPENIKEAVNLRPDFIGFIFYKKSKRYVGANFSPNQTKCIPRGINKVGVFVNEPVEHVINIIENHHLDMVQLHGGESVDYCQSLKNTGKKIIKVFSIGNSLPREKINEFHQVTDIYLFDTKTENYGGSGKKFKWDILKKLNPGKPFIISGGIGPEDVEGIISFDHPDFYGVDLNSKFEIEPALKDAGLLHTFINKIRAKA